MYKFTFVILHYLTIDDTIECVESILEKIDYPDYKIIIVDNASPNKTGEKLSTLYKDNLKITVIINSENLGFAKGNNVGFKYAKERLNSNFIALINNDTIIEDADFISIVLKKYEISKFDVLGPDVVSLADKKHQNPRELTIKSKARLIKLIRHHRFLLGLNYFMIDSITEKLKKKFFPKPFISNSSDKYLNYSTDQTNVKLSGCCLIFSQDYIKRSNGLFPETFLFSEEEILYYICKRDNLRILYSPDTSIIHKEDSTLNAL
ncbi:MAG: glycosyltransferase family 2 protein, partial [Ignavibacteria bacterium]|nr:glycosyltransferase family 2 protein [Ignavibacteria bacterium]